MEDAIYDNQAIRDFVGIDLSREAACCKHQLPISSISWVAKLFKALLAAHCLAVATGLCPQTGRKPGHPRSGKSNR